jgi:hypothetical protein
VARRGLIPARENVPDLVGQAVQGAIDALPDYQPPRIPPREQIARFMQAVQDPAYWQQIASGKSEQELSAWIQRMGVLMERDRRRR